MAKSDKDLFGALRDAGLRKKVARSLSDSAGSARSGKSSKAVSKSAGSLRSAATMLERRAEKVQRSQAAKKAARARKRNAATRSAAAKKAARTRAKSR